jgi:hypothetical protein
MATSKTNFFVVPAPGWYGAVTRVLSAHTDLRAACTAAMKAGQKVRHVVRYGELQPGDTFYGDPASDTVYPIAKGT